jgi:predicted Zn finger-like uncharacterized protein
MDVVCPKCQSRITIAADRIPAGKVAALTCPRCKHRIMVRPESESSAPVAPPAPAAPVAHAPPPPPAAGPLPTPPEQGEYFDELYDAEEKPFDFIEEQVKTALVCEDDEGLRKTVTDGLGLMEYHISVADNVRDALKKMRYHTFDLLVVNEHFGRAQAEANGVLIYAERMPISVRRNVYVAMISTRFRTLDDMMAFQHSVNLIINVRNFDRFDRILARGLADRNFLYRIFSDMVKDAGYVG